MSHSVAYLAALSVAAIPGFTPVSASRTSAYGPETSAAHVVDESDTAWIVRLPETQEAQEATLREVGIWKALSKNDGDDLPFALPRVVGRIDADRAALCVVHTTFLGTPIDLDELEPDTPAVSQIAESLAALHGIPPDNFADFDIPEYSADAYRRFRLHELRMAVGTGMVPGVLAVRWEEALSAGPHWEFTPTITHGSLLADHVLVRGGQLVTLTEWNDLRVADPADDLAFLVAGASKPVATRAVARYAACSPHDDDHLMERAQLAGELSIVRWLLHGVATNDASILTSAKKLLKDFAKDVAHSNAKK